MQVGSGANFQKGRSRIQRVQRGISKWFGSSIKYFKNINTASVRNGSIAQQIPPRSPIEGFVQK